MKATIIAIFLAAAGGAFLPLSGQDQRNTPITVNLIVEGSEELAGVLNDVGSRLSDSLVDGILQNGDSLTIWSAGESPEILYSQTISAASDKENIKKILKNLPARGDSADFAGALRQIPQRAGRNIQLTLLVNASHGTLSPAISGPSAQFIRYSRVEEYSGWRMLVIAQGIDDRVRQAAAAFFAGN